jgi:lipid-A-disaccharide synthase
VWAARPGRARTLAAAVDLLIALHPMDPPFFEAQGLKTVVVGNPALHVDMSKADPDGWRQAQGLTPDTPVLLVLPGSRPAEIRHMMPVFGEAMARLHKARPDLVFAMPLADTVRQQVLDALKAIPVPVRVIEGETDKFSAMKAATLALACSGTVSTELALAGCPMVIAYKLEPLTYFIYRRISTLKHATMFNIMVDRRIAPEFIQGDATPDNLVKAVTERLDDPALRARQVAEQYQALDVMGRGQEPPADKAAAALLEFLASKTQ